MLQPKTINVVPLEGYILAIDFSDGKHKYFDMNPYLKEMFYKSLSDKDLFKTVHIGGMSIEWDNGCDISPHELYEYSYH